MRISQTVDGNGRASFQFREPDTGRLIAEVMFSPVLGIAGWTLYMAPQRDGYGRMTWVINGHDAMPVGAYENLADAFREVEYLASLTIVAGP